ncbi:MAG: efflux RND transporter permease subunit [Pseudomonadota bacterium]
MWLSDLSVKRPVLATVFALLLIVAGLISLQSLPVREYPDVSSAVVSIRTNYSGASAAIVDSQITEIVEGAVSGVEGIKTISSSSETGSSQVNVEFLLDRDTNEAANDIRDRVGRILNRLPEDADPPQIAKQDSDARPILYINLLEPSLSPVELTDYAERYIVEQFAAVSGVSSVLTYGAGRPTLRIWIDRNALAARSLTIADIEAALRRENVEFPAGILESQDREFPIRVARGYLEVEDFERLVVAEAGDGHLIRLAEVARVEIGPRNPRSVFRTNGENTVAFGVIKQSTANTVDVIGGVLSVVERLNASMPGDMQLVRSTDESVFIRAAVRTVYWTIGITTLLVGLVIFAFLTAWRATAIPMITIPVCLVATLSVLALFGYSINLITLLALVLCIGLVVDDAIVVLENVFRRIQKGEPALLASKRGASQVVFAVIATTTVLVAVFAPILFLTDSIGRIFGELAVTICAALILSSVLALSVVPMLCSKLLKGHGSEFRQTNAVSRYFERLSERYRKLLERALDLRAYWVALALAVGVSSVLLITSIEREYAPEEDRGFIVGRFVAPEGASLPFMMENVARIETEPLKMLDDGILNRVLIRIPGFGGGDASNNGFIVMNLVRWDQRDVSTQDVVDHLNRTWASIRDVRVFTFSRSPIGGRGRPVEFVIGGTSYEELAGWRDRIMERARQNPGLGRVDADLKETQPQLIVNVDNDRAAILGVPVEEIGRSLQVLMSDQTTTTYVRDGEEYDVVVQAESSQRSAPSDLTNVYVRSQSSGELVALSNVVTLEEVAEPGSLNRFNRLRSVTISANLNDGYTLGEALGFLNDVAAEELPPSAQIDYRGESREYVDSGSALLFTFALALVIVYLVLSAQFESFVQPVVIMCTVPLAIAGGLLGLLVSDTTLNIYSQIGMLMLIGIATKNGILIVEFINQVRDSGEAFRESIVSASVMRFRPVLMTTASTVMGSVPLMLARGPGSEGLQALGVVIFFGVAIASVLTLFVAPVLYSILCRGTGSPDEIAQELQELERAH